MGKVKIDYHLWSAMKKVVKKTESSVYKLGKRNGIVLRAALGDRPKSWPSREIDRTSPGWWVPQKQDGRLLTVKRLSKPVSPHLIGIDKVYLLDNGAVSLIESPAVRDSTLTPRGEIELIGEGLARKNGSATPNLKNTKDSTEPLGKGGAGDLSIENNLEKKDVQNSSSKLENRGEIILRGERKGVSSQPRDEPKWDINISETWVLRKWAKLRERALDYLARRGVVPVCPLCKERELDRSTRGNIARKLTGRTMVQEFISHLERSHNISGLRALPRDKAGDITLVTGDDDLIIPAYTERKS